MKKNSTLDRLYQSVLSPGQKLKILGWNWGVNPPGSDYRDKQCAYFIASHANGNMLIAYKHDSEGHAWGGVCGQNDGRGNVIGDGLIEKFKSDEYRFWWVSPSQFNQFEVGKGSNMQDKIVEAGKNLGSAIGEGAAMGVCARGVDYGYDYMVEILHQQFGISKEKLQDPVNQELVKLLAAATGFMISSVGEDYVPGAKMVQQATQSVIKYKVASNVSTLVDLFGPMVAGMAKRMNPFQEQQAELRVAQAVRVEAEDESPAETEAAEEFAEAIASVKQQTA